MERIAENYPIIPAAIAYIQQIFRDEFSGHDSFHTMRVYRMAMRLATEEHADLEMVALAALLHDVDDRKLSPETCKRKERAVTFLKNAGVEDERIRQIRQIIEEVSFAGTDSVMPSSIEGCCVQDADRLDALGAIGIARTFAYGGNHNQLMYHPDIQPLTDMNKETYENHVSTSVNHFYEKLFLLKDMMTTTSGKRMAEERDAYMRDFLKHFLREWNEE